MIKNRMEAKRKDNENTHGPVPEDAKAALKDKLYDTKSRVNPQLQPQQTVDCPVILSGAEQLSKRIV